MKIKANSTAFVFIGLLALAARAECKTSEFSMLDQHREIPYMIRVEGRGKNKAAANADFQANLKDQQKECRAYGGTDLVFLYGPPTTQKTDEGYVTAAVGRCE